MIQVQHMTPNELKNVWNRQGLVFYKTSFWIIYFKITELKLISKYAYICELIIVTVRNYTTNIACQTNP